MQELEAETASSVEHLQHVFRLLSLVLDREPVRIAWGALRAGDATLRGTALEYLDNVLPDTLRAALWPRLGQPAPSPPRARQHQEVVDDLLRSSEGIEIRREWRARRG